MNAERKTLNGLGKYSSGNLTCTWRAKNIPHVLGVAMVCGGSVQKDYERREQLERE